MDLTPQARAADVCGDPLVHCADGKHRIHRPELLLAAPIQNIGIGRKHVQHLGRARCATRRLNVLHQIRELFRRDVRIRIRFNLLESGLFLSRRKLVKDIRARAWLDSSVYASAYFRPATAMKNGFAARTYLRSSGFASLSKKSSSLF